MGDRKKQRTAKALIFPAMTMEGEAPFLRNKSGSVWLDVDGVEDDLGSRKSPSKWLAAHIEAQLKSNGLLFLAHSHIIHPSRTQPIAFLFSFSSFPRDYF